MLRTNAGSAGSVLLAALMAVQGWGQEIDVEAGDTDVRVDQQGVDVEADPDRRDPATRQNRRDARPAAGAAAMNRNLASWMIVDQRALIDLAKFGIERTKTPEVRQLAEAIVQDHQSLVEQLETFRSPRQVDDQDAAAEDRTRPVGADQRQERRRDRAEAREDSDRPLENLADRLERGAERVAERAERVVDEVRGAIGRESDPRDTRRGLGVNWLAIHREIADALVEQSKQNLEQESGYQFDASLVGMFVAAHLKQEATLEVMQKHASGELRETIGQALKIESSHRQQAEQVMETIKPSHSGANR